MPENIKAMMGGSDAYVEVELDVDKAKLRIKTKSAKPGTFSLELNRPKKAK